MRKAVLYIHGKGGNAGEAEHYRPLFPDCDVIGLDYQAQTPWEAKEEFPELFRGLCRGYDSVSVIANSIGAFFTMSALADQKIERAFFISPVVDMEKLGPWNITIDCDVLQGDGGTRTASITGGFVAMMLAFKNMMEHGELRQYPVTGYVAAVSAGIVENKPMLDLCYEEDSSAMVDLNCVMDDRGRLIEIQGTGEERPFTLAEQQELVRLCEKGIRQLQEIQKEVLA